MPELTLAYSARTTAGSPTSAATRAGAWCRSRTSRCSIPRRAAAELERAVARRLPRRLRRALHAHAEAARAPRPRRALREGRASSTCRSRSIRPSSRSGRCRCASSGLGREREFFYNVMLRQGMQQAFLSFFALGTLERFPSLRLGVLESGCGWIGAFLDRMDAVAETISGRGASARDEAERATSAASASSRATRTRRRRRTSSTTSAPTASCGRPTTRTPTIRAHGRARSSASSRRSRRRRARSCSARTCGASTGSREGRGHGAGDRREPQARPRARRDASGPGRGLAQSRCLAGPWPLLLPLPPLPLAA